MSLDSLWRIPHERFLQVDIFNNVRVACTTTCLNTVIINYETQRALVVFAVSGSKLSRQWRSVKSLWSMDGLGRMMTLCLCDQPIHPCCPAHVSLGWRASQ